MTDLSSGPLDLDAIEKRAEAALRGPWRVSDSHGLHVRGGGDSVSPAGQMVADLEQAAFHYTAQGARADAEFIAAARTDVPALVAALRETEGDAASWRLRHKDACAEMADLRAKRAGLLARAEAAEAALAASRKSWVKYEGPSNAIGLARCGAIGCPSLHCGCK